ncbi:MAG: hypothetical protein CME64_09270 [Halobacteriovoraceae bacterium]|nr:hypothetical protein [Halobacteriovoraceae bacterium]|tara:strand:+ start:36583 stop:36819 length:237 start_codon:yes stop_codon:yes gene_type:complete
MKNKNPLYVVKGKDVEQAHGLVDLIIKKLNLQPAIDFFEYLFNLLLSMVDSYPKLKAVREFMDMVVARVKLFKSFSFA